MIFGNKLSQKGTSINTLKFVWNLTDLQIKKKKKKTKQRPKTETKNSKGLENIFSVEQH